MDHTTSAPLRADVSGDFQMDDYAIDPADQAIADQIMDFDAVHDTPGNVTFKGNVRLPDSIPLTALPPSIADPIRAKLNQLPVEQRAAEERKLIDAAVYDRVLINRIKYGAGPVSLGSNAYQQESLAVARDHLALHAEFADLCDKLAEVAEVRYGGDERTGTKTEITVRKVEGNERRRMEVRLAEITRSAQALEVEGERRKAKALKEAVEAHKALHAMVAEEAEVDQRAKHMAREERINAKAAKRAAINRHHS